MCGDECTDLLFDEAHCGDCELQCDTGETCDDGDCRCQDGLSRCNDSCVDTGTNGNNCGECGTKCAAGLVCSEGTCAPDCEPGRTACDGGCFDTDSSSTHCGACGRACDAGFVCTSGICTCPEGLTQCGEGCFDTDASGSHCGSCSTSCDAGELCSGGGCFCPVGAACDNTTMGGSDAGTGSSNSGGASPGGANAGGTDSSGGMGPGGASPGTGGTSSASCTDDLPQNTDWPEATCQMWVDAGECDAMWFAPYCDVSCGRCTPDTGTGGADSGGGGTGGGGATGSGNPWGTVSATETGWMSRYWNCCKPTCAWPGKGGNSPIISCDESTGAVVDPATSNSCKSGGTAMACNSYAPWAYSDEVSLGFVATHAGTGVACGTCYHVQFSGASFLENGDVGSAALAGKTMIVMATNIEGDVSSSGQMGLMIPGGGVESFYGCDVAWGVAPGNPDLGANYGGLRVGCSGDLDTVKTCVANKCQTFFGDRGLDEMYDGCMWYATWFEAAEYPEFVVEPIACPQELSTMVE